METLLFLLVIFTIAEKLHRFEMYCCFYNDFEKLQ